MLWHYFPLGVSKKKEDLGMCPDNVEFIRLAMHFLFTFQLVKLVMAGFNRLRIDWQWDPPQSGQEKMFVLWDIVSTPFSVVILHMLCSGWIQLLHTGLHSVKSWFVFCRTPFVVCSCEL